MNVLIKTIFWTAISFIGVCFLIDISGWLLPIEQTNEDIELIYAGIRFFGIPAAILLTLVRVIKKRDSTVDIIVKAFTICFLAFCSACTVLLLVVAESCSSVTDHIIFENKRNPAIRIETRHIDCGATDTQMPNPKTYLVRPLMDNFNWVTKIDTNEIDRNAWCKKDNQ